MKKRLVAERVGFEPTVHETCTPVFETGTLNHSDTSPLRKARRKFTAMPTIVKKAVNQGTILRIRAYVRVYETGALAVHGFHNRRRRFLGLA